MKIIRSKLIMNVMIIMIMKLLTTVSIYELKM